MPIGNALLLAVSVCSFISYLPQIIKTINTRSSEDISISSWAINSISMAAYVAYAFFISNDPMLVFATGCEFIFTATILLLAIKYRNNKG